MPTRVATRSTDRAESFGGYPTLRAAAAILGVAASTLSRRADVQPLQRGARDRVLPPAEVMRLAAIYRKRSLNEVAAELIDHAAEHGPDDAERAEEAVEAFFAGRSRGESLDEFLEQARRHLPDDLYAEVERTVRKGAGERPASIVGRVPSLVDGSEPRSASRKGATKRSPAKPAASRKRKLPEVSA